MYQVHCTYTIKKCQSGVFWIIKLKIQIFLRLFKFEFNFKYIANDITAFESINYMYTCIQKGLAPLKIFFSF